MPISVNGANGITFADGSIQNTGASGFGFKNRIINGAMMIDQRNNGSSITSDGFVVDRFQVISNTSDFTSNRSTTVPSGQPFKNSIYIKPTATKTPGAGTYAAIITNIEGFNIVDMMWGTAAAKSITVSFWVRSSKIGTYCWGTKNADATRSYSVTYTINAANTWEYKSFTVPGCTDGSWPVDNTRGITCDFWLAGNNTQSSTKNAWYAGNINMNTDQVNFFDSTSNEFYLTGVQIEVGSTATAFDYRDYGRELMMCQRYFSKIGGTTSGEPVGTGNIQDAPNSAWVYVKFPTTMRAAPTLAYSQLQIVNNANYALAVSSIRGQYAGLDSANFGVNCSSNGTTFAAVQLQTSATAGYLSMSAEL